MPVNNFKKLEEEYISTRQDKDLIKLRISQETGIFRFIGDLVELFLPRMVNSLLGNHKSTIKQKKYPNQ
jgi:hypothetical protein